MTTLNTKTNDETLYEVSTESGKVNVYAESMHWAFLIAKHNGYEVIEVKVADNS